MGMQKKRNSVKKAKSGDTVRNERQITLQEKMIFDLEQLLEISLSLNSQIEFDRLIESILYTAMAQLRTFEVGVFTKKTFDDTKFTLYKNHYGMESNRQKSYGIDVDHPLIKTFAQKDHCIEPREIPISFLDEPCIKNILSLNPSLFVPLRTRNELQGFFVLGERIDKNEKYSEYDKILMLRIASLAAVAINNSQLLEMTSTDIMTHLKLKHYFYTVLTKFIETAEIKDTVSILMLDLDFFKNINDTYGHNCGDVVLKRVADAIKSCVRSSDLAARYGGEEFVVMLTYVDIVHAVVTAERIRKAIENMQIIFEDEDGLHTISITISIGVAQYIYGAETAKNIVERADKALYKSKESGRNRVTVSEKNRLNPSV